MTARSNARERARARAHRAAENDAFWDLLMKRLGPRGRAAVVGGSVELTDEDLAGIEDEALTPEQRERIVAKIFEGSQ